MGIAADATMPAALVPLIACTIDRVLPAGSAIFPPDPERRAECSSQDPSLGPELFSLASSHRHWASPIKRVGGGVAAGFIGAFVEGDFAGLFLERAAKICVSRADHLTRFSDGPNVSAW